MGEDRIIRSKHIWSPCSIIMLVETESSMNTMEKWIMYFICWIFWCSRKLGYRKSPVKIPGFHTEGYSLQPPQKPSESHWKRMEVQYCYYYHVDEDWELENCKTPRLLVRPLVYQMDSFVCQMDNFVFMRSWNDEDVALLQSQQSEADEVVPVTSFRQRPLRRYRVHPSL